MSVRASLFCLSVDAMTKAEAIETIRGIWRRSAKSRVFFVSAHCFNTLVASPAYYESLRGAEFLLPAGSGVMLASKLLHLPIRHNLNGTDLTPLLCKAAAQDGCSVYLLGARPGVAQKAAAALQKRYPTLRIAGIRDGSFTREQSAEVVAEINAAHPDLLLVALGVPLQEMWITEQFADLNVPVSLGVDALFDFLAGVVPRAPRPIRRLGLEWLYRFGRQPSGLWKRYLVGNVVFLWRVLGARLGRWPDPEQDTSLVRTMPASLMLAASPRNAPRSAPFAELPIPQRGNMRWSAGHAANHDPRRRRRRAGMASRERIETDVHVPARML